MKAFWKALGIAALAAAVPVRFKKDEETGKKTYQSLLLSVDVGPGEEGEGTAIGVNIGDGLLSSAVMNIVTKKETVHFADDEPEAAVVPGVIDFAQAAAEQAQMAAEEGQVAAEELQEAAEAAQEAAEEFQAAAEEAQAAAEEVTEEDFDPEL